MVMSRTVTPTTPWRACGLIVAWAMGTAVAPRPLLSFGYSCSSRCPMVTSWARAVFDT